MKGLGKGGAVKVRRRDVGVMVKHVGIVAIWVASGRELDLGEIRLVWPLTP